MKKIIFEIIIILTASAIVSAQNGTSSKKQEVALTCKTCHNCEFPTRLNPCLKECPRADLLTVHHSPNEGPDVVIIDKLTKLYVPVMFSHRLHAQMSEMSGGCKVCHHHNPAGPVLGCVKCHETNPQRSDLSRPGLKGAYHRQCFGCHREWSHSTRCAVCHAAIDSQIPLSPSPVQDDIIGKEHPPVPEPDKVVYETTYKEGKIVTFYHDDHVNQFGFKCVTCHQEENCGKCHDQLKKESTSSLSTTRQAKQMLPDEHHKPCIECHQKDACSFCHVNNVQAHFDHEKRTNWKLNKAHKKLVCTSCHGNNKRFKSVDNRCFVCHKNWNIEKFNHQITGVHLDETHIEVDCSSCHVNEDFQKQPVCDECHEGYTFPQKVPGSLVKN